MPVSKSIYLTGFMGSGKSTVGKLLAQKLRLAFVDLDEYIENVTGRTIADIFQKDGENVFRKVEEECLKHVLEDDRIKVVALGGGTVCYGDNLSQVLDNGELIYLLTNLHILVDRLSENEDVRPLLGKLKGKSLEDFINDKLVERQPYYIQASKIVNGDKNAEEIAEEILMRLE